MKLLLPRRALAFAWSASFYLSTFTALSAAEASSVLKVEVSPKGSFFVEHRTDRNTRHKIWLVSASRQDRRLLFKPDQTEADYDPTILVSPDERWIVRNQTRGSTSTRVALHVCKAPLIYAQAGRLDSTAWNFAARVLRIPPGRIPPFHGDVEAIKWLDSSTLLLQLRGDSPGGFQLREWRCVYDVKRRTFSLPRRYLKPSGIAAVSSSPGGV